MAHYTATTPIKPFVVGVISDTHGVLPPDLPEIFQAVNCIIHAGDFGGMEIVKELQNIATLYAISGNVDAFDLPKIFPKKRQVNLSGVKFFIEHNIQIPVNHYLKLKRDPLFSDSDVVIYGHTHVPKIENFGDYLYFNPGSTCQPRKGYKPSIGIIEILNEEITRKEIIIL